MLNSAKIIPALQRKCAISEKIRWGLAPRPSPGSATVVYSLPLYILSEQADSEQVCIVEFRVLDCYTCILRLDCYTCILGFLKQWLDREVEHLWKVVEKDF